STVRQWRRSGASRLGLPDGPGHGAAVSLRRRRKSLPQLVVGHSNLDSRLQDLLNKMRTNRCKDPERLSLKYTDSTRPSARVYQSSRSVFPNARLNSADMAGRETLFSVHCWMIFSLVRTIVPEPWWVNSSCTTQPALVSTTWLSLDRLPNSSAEMETRLFGVKATSSMVFLSEMDFLVTIGLKSPAPNQQRLSALLPLPSRWSQLSSSATRQFRMSFKPRLLNTLRICLVQASCRDS
uniref:Family with sequence similarity 189, member A1 n=1 Tax=Macrostomum lignano TaxID=282301 RepID=A0A1I8IEH3_9PLAT